MLILDRRLNDFSLISHLLRHIIKKHSKSILGEG